MEEKATYQCMECPKKFMHKGTLNRHKRSIHEQLGSICPNGGVKFSREFALKRHMENCGKIYECDVCDKSYNTITYLKILQKCLILKLEKLSHTEIREILKF